MLKLLMITPLIMVSTAVAQPQPDVPDEQTKVLALKLGYALNGNSMVRWGAIDLSRNALSIAPFFDLPTSSEPPPPVLYGPPAPLKLR